MIASFPLQIWLQREAQVMVVGAPLWSRRCRPLIPSQLCPVNVTAVVTFKDMPVSMNQDVGVLEAGAGAKALYKHPR